MTTHTHTIAHSYLDSIALDRQNLFTAPLLSLRKEYSRLGRRGPSMLKLTFPARSAKIRAGVVVSSRR
jgi:hypothetical protein